MLELVLATVLHCSMATEAVLMNESSVNPATNSSLNRWLLKPELVGPPIAVVVAVEFILSLTANLFISVHTVLNAKNALKKSSTVFLFNLSLSNLLIAVFYMPFVIVALSAEEWIFGGTDEVRDGFCRFTGLVFSYSISVSLYTLAAISFDRFLFIVKPHLHRRWMTWKTTLGIVIFVWVSANGQGEQKFSVSQSA